MRHRPGYGIAGWILCTCDSSTDIKLHINMAAVSSPLATVAAGLVLFVTICCLVNKVTAQVSSADFQPSRPFLDPPQSYCFRRNSRNRTVRQDFSVLECHYVHTLSCFNPCIIRYQLCFENSLPAGDEYPGFEIKHLASRNRTYPVPDTVLI